MPYICKFCSHFATGSSSSLLEESIGGLSAWCLTAGKSSSKGTSYVVDMNLPEPLSFCTDAKWPRMWVMIYDSRAVNLSPSFFKYTRDPTWTSAGTAGFAELLLERALGAWFWRRRSCCNSLIALSLISRCLEVIWSRQKTAKKVWEQKSGRNIGKELKDYLWKHIFRDFEGLLFLLAASTVKEIQPNSLINSDIDLVLQL